MESTNNTLNVASEDSPSMPILPSGLAEAHYKRLNLKCELDDIHKVIRYRENVLSLSPHDSLHMLGLLETLGSSHGERFQRLGDINDIELAIGYTGITLALTHEGHEDLPRHLANLGMMYGERFKRLGELADVEAAIKYEVRALNLTPDGHPFLPNRLANLGASHTYRFQRLGELADVEAAMAYESRALDLTHNGHPDLPSRLANLGVSHSYRFQRLGELTDLEKAIQYESRAVNLTHAGHPHLSSRLANLGVSQKNRFERLGDLTDLNKAIQYQSCALDLTPTGHPDLPSRLVNLAVTRKCRFGRVGELSDLEEAIRYETLALDLTPGGHPQLPSRLTNLGISHKNRFNRLEELGDLERAIHYESRALNLTPDDHPQLSSRVSNIGASYSYRFVHLGELADIEKAIQYESRALGLTPDGHPHFSGMLANLGTSHSYRFQCLGELADLEKALVFQSRAIASTPDHHPHLAFMHLHYARSSFFYYQRTNDFCHLDQALHSFRMATRSTTSTSRDMFRYARQWAKLACKHSVLNPIEAYQAVIDHLPQFIWLGTTINQRYKDILIMGTLAIDAAYAAILSSDYALALEWLEHTRCVVSTQNVMLRSPLDHLQSVHPALAHRLQTVATHLHSVSSNPREFGAIASSSITSEQVAQVHRRLAREYNELLCQARMLPGFEHFLRPIKAKSMIDGARHGPVIVINCHDDRCDALIIQPGRDHIAHIPLCGFTKKNAQRAHSQINQSLRYNGLRERGVKPLQLAGHKGQFGNLLRVLWHNLVKPVLDHLGYTSNVQKDNLPHITWCPTGALSFLPLHAAGDYDIPRSRVFDYVISSYTPTLTALLTSTPSSLSHNSGVLGIGLQFTPGHNLLPGTATELASVQGHVHGTAQYIRLANSQATTNAVLDAMKQNSWVHLACHAYQNFKDPTKSGFYLHDGILDLASINRQSFKDKGLAFLSACQTARGDETLPDEAVHLASGMLMAGYTSVIATMWSVVDTDAPIVTDGVYARLLPDGKLGNGEAGRALHEAVSLLREKVGEEKFERWVPFIHIGS